MKIFLDHANPEIIKKYSSIIDGVTTNPSLIAREQCFHGYHDAIKQITTLIDGPVSVEVLNTDANLIIREAEELASLSQNIVIKIPAGLEGFEAMKKLARKGIRTNATLIFSVNQALLAAKAGASYLSIFVGRLDDTGQDGVRVVQDIVQIVENYGFQSEVLAASIRHPLHVMQVALAGSHVATIPPGVIDQICKHPLTDKGLEIFLTDWKNTGKDV
jgi:transaldolase